jgi:hypothetical protein
LRFCCWHFTSRGGDFGWESARCGTRRRIDAREVPLAIEQGGDTKAVRPDGTDFAFVRWGNFAIGLLVLACLVLWLLGASAQTFVLVLVAYLVLALAGAIVVAFLSARRDIG